MSERITMGMVRVNNPLWFAPGAKKFAGDLSYRVEYSNKGLPYLVRGTMAFSGMLGIPKKHYRINPIDPDEVSILSLIPDEFETMKDVDAWLLDH